MTFEPSAQPGTFADGKPLSSQELRELRSQVWAEGSVSAEEAGKLFDMNRSVKPSAEWTDFFVEAICEFMLSQGEPRGFVTEDEASWLLRRVNREGRIETHAELELIAKLLERAEYAPTSLRRFALGAIEQTVLCREGPTGEGQPANAPSIGDAEAAMIRRLIFAPSSDGPAKVSTAEAELLFRLKDATLGQANSPEWKKLFVQGVANHLMAHQSYTPSSPSDQVRLEAPHESHPFSHSLGGLGPNIAGPHELRDALFGHDEEEASQGFDHQVEADAEITRDESEWLKRLYDKDAQHDEYEQALLDFLAKDAAHPL